MSGSKIILFGGNGFVGCVIAEQLIGLGITPVCVSRSGTKPAHLDQAIWAEKVVWVQGDAVAPERTIFENAIAVICLVGSPPLPTFTNQAYRNQLFANSQPNLGAIAAAKEAGITQLVLLGAHLPRILMTDKFAYAKGKRLCLEAARDFAEVSEAHGAAVLQPTAIYGTRHNPQGKPIELGKIMRPISRTQGATPNFVGNILPEQFVSVDAVASTAVSACVEQAYQGKFSVISNQQILQNEKAPQ